MQRRDELGRFSYGDGLRQAPGQLVGLDGADELDAPDIHLDPEVMVVVHGLREQGLRPMLVGGSVRDAIEGHEPKDIDFEVYPLDGATSFGPDELARVARRFGRVDEVGKSFGVLKMRAGDADLDLSLPRRENKVAAGHRGFEVDCDPTMSFEEATARRDYTMNAMMHDPATGEFVDPHHGLSDHRQHVLRAVGPAFDEDPLRVLRGMQFAGRFDMTMEPGTVERCRRLRGEAGTLASERLRTEWGKWATKSVRPSAGLTVLSQTGWDTVMPGMRGVADDPEVHAEVERLAASELKGSERQVALDAALVRRMSDDDARAFLNVAIDGSRLQRTAFQLSRSNPLPDDDAGLRHAAHGPVALRLVGALHAQDEAVRRAHELGVAEGPEPTWVTGNDIMAATGRTPGPWMSEAMERVRQAQADRLFADRAQALEWLRLTASGQ